MNIYDKAILILCAIGAIVWLICVFITAKEAIKTIIDM